jgi:hypothetical protein
MKKWWRFVYTIAPWPMPVRHKFAEHSRQLLQVKNERGRQKKMTPQLAFDSEFFHRAFANPCMM